MKNLRFIAGSIREHRFGFFQLILLSSAVALSVICVPVILRLIVNSLMKEPRNNSRDVTSADQIYTLLPILLVVLILSLVLRRHLACKSMEFFLAVVGTLRAKLFDTFTRLPLDYFESMRLGDSVDRFGAIVEIALPLLLLTDVVLLMTFQLMFALVILFHTSILVGVVAIAIVPLEILLVSRSLRGAQPQRRKWLQHYGQLAALISEMLAQIVTVRTCNGESTLRIRYEYIQASWRSARNAERVIEQNADILAQLASACFLVFCVSVVGIEYHIGNGRSLGDLLLVVMLAQTIISVVQPIAQFIGSLRQLDATAERVVEFFKSAPSGSDDHGAVELQRIVTIEFRNVSFLYKTQADNVLDCVSFSVKRGERLAIVGPSGSGKSTIVKLLLRLYDPSEGQILINGRDVKDYTLNSLRATVGVVMQDVALFNGSVRDNICFGVLGSSESEVNSAAIAANAVQFIEQLPQKYETTVGERGVKLSGGERQRLAIARALIRDPQLIIFDEATSSLDSASEALVQESMERLADGRITIAIAHRLSTVVRADNILVIDCGRIVERGTHRSLIEDKGGLYSKLHALQADLV